MVTTRNYENIKTFQIADRLLDEIYKITINSFPHDEKYCLTSQIRRAALSITANIVEGSARKHKKEYIHFLYIAKGSLKETEYYLKKSLDFGYLDKESYKAINSLCLETGRLLYGLLKAVEQSN